MAFSRGNSRNGFKQGSLEMKIRIFGQDWSYDGEAQYDFVDLFGDKHMTIKFNDKEIEGVITLDSEEVRKLIDYPTPNDVQKSEESNRPLSQFKKTLEQQLKVNIQEVYKGFCSWNEGEKPVYQKWWRIIYPQARNRELMFKGVDYKFTERKLKLGETKFLKKKLEQHNNDGLFHWFMGLNHVKQGFADVDEWHNALLHPFKADGLVDVDAENIEEAVKIAKDAVKYASEKGLNYDLHYTGKKGFHLLIPHEDMVKFYGLPNQDPLKKTYELNDIDNARKDLMEDFQGQGVECDTSTSARQQMKRIVGSIHPATGRVCTRIKPKDLENFSQTRYNIENFKTYLTAKH